MEISSYHFFTCDINLYCVCDDPHLIHFIQIYRCITINDLVLFGVCNNLIEELMTDAYRFNPLQYIQTDETITDPTKTIVYNSGFRVSVGDCDD